MTGRRDTERYEWRLVESHGAAVPSTREARLARLAERFLSFTAPVTAKEFADWLGVSQRDALAALRDAGGVPVTVEDHGLAFVLEEQLGEMTASSVDETPRFLPFEDLFVVVAVSLFSLVRACHGVDSLM